MCWVHVHVHVHMLSWACRLFSRACRTAYHPFGTPGGGGSDTESRTRNLLSSVRASKKWTARQAVRHGKKSQNARRSLFDNSHPKSEEEILKLARLVIVHAQSERYFRAMEVLTTRMENLINTTMLTDRLSRNLVSICNLMQTCGQDMKGRTPEDTMNEISKLMEASELNQRALERGVSGVEGVGSGDSGGSDGMDGPGGPGEGKPPSVDHQIKQLIDEVRGEQSLRLLQYIMPPPGGDTTLLLQPQRPPDDRPLVEHEKHGDAGPES